MVVFLMERNPRFSRDIYPPYKIQVFDVFYYLSARKMYLLSTELSWDRGIMGFFLQTSDQMLKISCLSVTFECCFVEHVNINCIINSRMH